ncbi:MAG: sigma-70 family RNA polymerase sigma factor [Crocinitomicaceae bacterium]|nr:sigma-70 family RNA polymerase sigma factor [Crocinitomicaceae bacterium]
MTDQKLIERILKGSSDGSRMLYNKYAPYIFTICKRYNVPNNDLKDAMQNIFMECFQNIERFDSQKGVFKFWLRSIAINQILSSKRKKRLTCISLDEVRIDTVFDSSSVLDGLALEEIVKVLEEMPEQQAMIFNLFVIDGYSHVEIAEILDINVNTSKSHLHRARKWAIKSLEKIKGEEDSSRKKLRMIY